MTKRILKGLLKFVLLWLFAGLVFLMFVNRSGFEMIYLGTVLLIILYYSYKKGKEGESFNLNQTRLIIKRKENKEYDLKEYNVRLSESINRYGMFLVFKNREMLIYNLSDNQRVVDVIDCNNLSSKKFIELEWDMRTIRERILL